MPRKATMDALLMASTKNIRALYNAKYIDSGRSSGIKGIMETLGSINSNYEKMRVQEEKQKSTTNNQSEDQI